MASRQAKQATLVVLKEVLTEESSDKLKRILKKKIKSKLPGWAKWIPIGQILDALLPEVLIDFFEDIYERLVRPRMRDTISTGIEPLDDALRGGTAKGELTVVLAPTSKGKTTMLINLGVGAMNEGKTVYHFFAEQNEDLIWCRYASCILNKPFPDIVKKPKKYTFAVQEFQARTGSKLRIAPCMKSSVNLLRAFIYRYGVPDALIIDYADKLVSAQKLKDFRIELICIYDDIVEMMREFGFAIWTASQTPKNSVNKKKIDLSDIAESMDKANSADNVLALCQTDIEAKSNDFRIFLAKVRNEEGGKEVRCKIFRNKMKIMSNESWLRLITRRA